MVDPNDPILPQDQQVDADYSYKDIHEQPIRDIAQGVEPETPPVEISTPPKEEIPLEDVVRNTARETAQKIIDDENVRRAKQEEDKLAEEAKKTQLQPNEEYKKIVDDFQTEKGRTPTWDELAVKIEERSIEKLEQRQAEKQRLAEEESNKAKLTQEENDKELNRYVDDELDELYNSGKLTRIKDANNPYDQGVIERKALFAKWGEVNMQRRAEGKPEVISATRIFHSFYTKPNAQPPGADAPIAGNRTSTVAPPDEQSYSYKDIKRPWSFFKNQK